MFQIWIGDNCNYSASLAIASTSSSFFISNGSLADAHAPQNLGEAEVLLLLLMDNTATGQNLLGEVLKSSSVQQPPTL